MLRCQAFWTRPRNHNGRSHALCSESPGPFSPCRAGPVVRGLVVPGHGADAGRSRRPERPLARLRTREDRSRQGSPRGQSRRHRCDPEWDVLPTDLAALRRAAAAGAARRLDHPTRMPINSRTCLGSSLGAAYQAATGYAIVDDGGKKKVKAGQISPAGRPIHRLRQRERRASTRTSPSISSRTARRTARHPSRPRHGQS